MKILTSISTKRIKRQQFCINSWLAVGCSVTAVQSKGEKTKLQKQFPKVEFKETDLVGDLFKRPKFVRISALLNEIAEDNAIILNSDIEIRCSPRDFQYKWREPDPNTIKVGIRWDEDEVGQLSLLQYGIDAFLITPDIASKLKDIGMTIGCPAWDYWIPIHLHREYGYTVEATKHQDLIHEAHPKNWNKDDFQVGLSLLRRYYNLGIRDASRMILQLTERV